MKVSVVLRSKLFCGGRGVRALLMALEGRDRGATAKSMAVAPLTPALPLNQHHCPALPTRLGIIELVRLGVHGLSVLGAEHADGDVGVGPRAADVARADDDLVGVVLADPARDQLDAPLVAREPIVVQEESPVAFPGEYEGR